MIEMDLRFANLLRPFLKFVGDTEIVPGSRLRDLGLDSMREVELLFALEDEFDVVFPDDQLIDGTFETAGSLWAAIDTLRSAGVSRI
jgi:acyl carrier protein